jgi:hypothetical protein
MQAFLQRVINGCGRVEREYGLGRQRTDLLIIWPYNGGQQRVVIQLKTLNQSLERTLETGLQQTTAYMNENGAADGHLIIFNRQPDQSWRQKIFRREKSYQGQTVTIWGM